MPSALDSERPEHDLSLEIPFNWSRCVRHDSAFVGKRGKVVMGKGDRVAIGLCPFLEKYGVTGTLADLKMEIHQNGVDAIFASSDNWDSATIRPYFQQVGIDNWDRGSKDSAVVMSLNPGGYTAIVSGVGNTTGVALIEVYELP